MNTCLLVSFQIWLYYLTFWSLIKSNLKMKKSTKYYLCIQYCLFCENIGMFPWWLHFQSCSFSELQLMTMETHLKGITFKRNNHHSWIFNCKISYSWAIVNVSLLKVSVRLVETRSWQLEGEHNLSPTVIHFRLHKRFSKVLAVCMCPFLSTNSSYLQFSFSLC